jgi:glycosyltransferase involved in cell wall biosynthesis
MVRVLHTPEHITGKKFGITLGIRAAKHDWILLTDADCRPNDKSWIRMMSRNFHQPHELVLGFSSYKRYPGLLNAFIRFETFLTGIQYVALSRLRVPYMGVGRNLAYKKSLFLENKGFHRHQSITGGDDDLFVNQHGIGRNTVDATGADLLVWSEPKKTWREFYFQKVRHLFAGKRYRVGSRLTLGFFSFSWLALWFFTLPVTLLMPAARWILLGIILRWILMISLFNIAPRKLGDRFEAWKVPLLDFIYAFYYLVAGMKAAVSKKVRWRV